MTGVATSDVKYVWKQLFTFCDSFFVREDNFGMLKVVSASDKSALFDQRLNEQFIYILASCL